MKHKLIYLSLLFLFLLGACQDEWDKHYLLDGNEGDDNATATIWEVILEILIILPLLLRQKTAVWIAF